MPSGKTHDRLTLWLLAPVFLLCLMVLKLGAGVAIIVTVGFWFGSIYLSPDLDTRSRAFYRWSIFRFIWWPYQWLVKHRSRWSHGIFTGTFFRLAYFSAVLILAWTLAGYALGIDPGIRLPRQDTLLPFVAGIWGGCLAHILMDAAGGWFRLPRL